MPHTNTINQESVDKIVDAVLCVGVPYMNESWVKFPKDQAHMIDGFRTTKGYKEAREQIKKLLEDVVRDTYWKNYIIQHAAEYPEMTLKEFVKTQFVIMPSNESETKST